MSTAMSRPLSPFVAFAGAAAAFGAFFLAAGAPTPLLSLRQQEWGFSAEALTFAFSVYALGLLAALLVGGSLSDHIGRRPVLLLALGGELVSMLVFVAAPDITWLVVARTIQGLATGLATSAFSAAIVEHAPPHLKKLAGGLAAASVAGGLGVGALVSGAAVQFTSHANTLVFGVLTAVMVLALGFVWLLDETAVKRPGALRSLAPQISLPTQVRREFYSGVPLHVATWMLAAFFLGLAPAVLTHQFGLTGGLVAGFTAFLGPFAAAVSTFVFARYAPRRSSLTGLSLAMLGMIVVFVGVTQMWLPALWIGSVIGGSGFGGAFGGQVRLIAPHVQAHQRASVFAGIYTVAYLSFGVPVIVAGQLIPRWGLMSTFELYAATVIILAAAGIILQASLARRDVVAAAAVVRSGA